MFEHHNPKITHVGTDQQKASMGAEPIVLQQQPNLGRRFGTSKMHISPLWLRPCPFEGRGSVVVDCCLLFLPLWESVIVLCFVVCYFMSILVLQSS